MTTSTEKPEARDPDQGSAGTSAYAMMAAMEQANIETTETLIHMIAAMILAKGIDPENRHQVFGQPDGSYAVTFSPADMDDMYRAYDMRAKREGMLTTVSIMPRSAAEMDPPTSLFVQDGDADDLPVKAQAPAAVYDRPVWAIRYYGNNGELYFASMHDKGDAERHLLDYVGRYDQPEPTIENRMCLHTGCPAEHCNEQHDA